MANSNIALGVRGVDAVSPMLAILQQQQQAVNNNRAERQLALQEQAGAQNSRINDLQIQGLEQQNAQQIQQAAARSIAQDTLALQQLFQAGDTESAGQLIGEMKQLASGAKLPLDGFNRLETLFGQDPAKAAQYLERAVMPKVRESLPAMFQDVTNEQGAVVGQRNMQTNQLSGAPEGMRPPDAFDQYMQEQDIVKNQLAIEGQQLQNERTQGQMAQDAAQASRAEQQAARQEQDFQIKARTDAEQQRLASGELSRAYNLINTILDPERGGALGNITGPIDSWMPTMRPSSADMQADIRELENLLTLGNLGRMSGVLSESDIKILSNAASGLSTAGSEKRTRDKLTEIQQRLAQNPRFQQATSEALSVHQAGPDLSADELSELERLRAKYGR